MDGPAYNGGDHRQIKIDRRRAAIRDFENARNRARGDLAFEFGKAIHDAPDDPSAAVRAVERVLEDQDWVIQRAWRALLRRLA